ncbi:MAG: Pr6Pr family membrane protein [Bacteroidales bacterium]|nr:Pr6Pr family membrane protein [Bacteroidales bacterium]
MKRNFSIALKALLALCAGVGIVLTMTNGHDGTIRWSYLLYFTIQSNIWVMLLAIAGIVIMLKNKESDRVWSILDLVVTVAITLTGFVYCFVLAPTIENPFRIDSVLVHVCSPVLAIVDYLVCGGMLTLKGKDSYWSIIPPFYYLIFASIGYVCNWPFSATTNYPYFFLNWGSPMGAFGIGSEFPFMGVMWYVLCIIIFLVLISRLYILIANRIGK